CSTAAYSYQATTIPPLIDVPTWSLSTKPGNNDDTDAVSTMNILTYASPVAIQPYRMWSISLYKGTLSHENFVKERRGILQLLRLEHAFCKVDDDIDGGKHGALIRVLGGSSGRDVDKETVCEELGFPWQTLECKGESKANDDNDVWPKVLPHCVYYLKLELVGEMIDCGSHDVALCRVVDMVMTTDDENINTNTNELDYISTRKLRDMDVISELGRIKEIS
ncbi:hypothetical protein ACHAWC_001794, partial [Mediolabrus comicus]